MEFAITARFPVRSLMPKWHDERPWDARPGQSASIRSIPCRSMTWAFYAGILCLRAENSWMSYGD